MPTLITLACATPLRAQGRHLLIYEFYQDFLKSCCACDFNDLLTAVCHLMESNSAIHTRIRGRFPYLLVDEFQDCNK